MTYDPIVKTLQLKCSAAHAFDVFVKRMATWWPLDSHAASVAAGHAAQTVTVEPYVGGAIYETMHDGGRNDWGKVLEYEEGQLFAMTWHPGNNANAATRVDVAFKALGADQCVVTLTHSGWEVWADEAGPKHDGYNSGWDFVFGQRYAECADARHALQADG